MIEIIRMFGLMVIGAMIALVLIICYKCVRKIFKKWIDWSCVGIAGNYVIATIILRWFMKQYTETYRITINKEMREKINKIKDYNIKPLSFIRIAIQEKLSRDLPMLKIESEKEKLPF